MLRQGLLHASLIPRRAQRELRELVRDRTSLIQARTAAINRIHALREGANRMRHPVISDLLGVSGRAILAALAAGETDAGRLSALGEGKPRSSRAAREAAVRGSMADHQRRMLQSQLVLLNCLEHQSAALSTEITIRLAPHAETRAPRHDSGRGPAHRRGDRRRRGHGHVPLSRRRACRLLGGPQSRPARARRTTPARPHAHGQSRRARGTDRGGARQAGPATPPLAARIATASPAWGQTKPPGRSRARRGCWPLS